MEAVIEKRKSLNFYLYKEPFISIYMYLENHLIPITDYQNIYWLPLFLEAVLNSRKMYSNSILELN